MEFGNVSGIKGKRTGELFPNKRKSILRTLTNKKNGMTKLRRLAACSPSESSNPKE